MVTDYGSSPIIPLCVCVCVFVGWLSNKITYDLDIHLDPIQMKFVGQSCRSGLRFDARYGRRLCYCCCSLMNELKLQWSVRPQLTASQVSQCTWPYTNFHCHINPVPTAGAQKHGVITNPFLTKDKPYLSPDHVEPFWQESDWQIVRHDSQAKRNVTEQNQQKFVWQQPGHNNDSLKQICHFWSWIYKYIVLYSAMLATGTHEVISSYDTTM